MAGKRQPAHNLNQVLAAVSGSRGVKSVIAQRLGVTRQTVTNYENRWAKVREAIHEERETLLDFAEVRLYEKVSVGDWQAVKYVLSTLGRSRGYDPTLEVDLSALQSPAGSIMVIEGPKDRFLSSVRDLSREGESLSGKTNGSSSYEPPSDIFDAFNDRQGGK
jgi:hypothetical protein